MSLNIEISHRDENAVTDEALDFIVNQFLERTVFFNHQNVKRFGPELRKFFDIVWN